MSTAPASFPRNLLKISFPCATHSILLLVSCFVFFYCANNIVTLYVFYTCEKIPRLEVPSGILSSCYPILPALFWWWRIIQSHPNLFLPCQWELPFQREHWMADLTLYSFVVEKDSNGSM
jgi:hypothetical protein